MGALIIAFIPIITALIGGTSINVILAALTIPQWAALAAAIANLAVPVVEEALKPEVEQQIRSLHPAFNKLWDDVQKHGPDKAAENAAAEFWPTGPGMLNT